MKTTATFTLGALACMGSTMADKKDPDSLVSYYGGKTGMAGGIIWHPETYTDGYFENGQPVRYQYRLCLIQQHKFHQRNGDNFKDKWNGFSDKKKKNKVDKGKPTPLCADTEVIWSDYCAKEIHFNYADEAAFVNDPETADRALFSVLNYGDEIGGFSILPSGNYCEHVGSGLYQLQWSENTSKGKHMFSIFKFEPFYVQNGHFPDEFFNFDDDNNLTYNDKTLSTITPKKGQSGVRESRMTFANDVRPAAKDKKFQIIQYGA